MSEKNNRGGARPGAGRKLVNAEEKRRTRSIMLSDLEYSELVEIARREGVSRSELIARWIAINK